MTIKKPPSPKVVNLKNVTEGEIVETSGNTTESVNIELMKEKLKLAVDDILKKHSEKGSLAFQLLQTAVSQNYSLFNTPDNTETYQQLVNSVFSLVDIFKIELDRRYSEAVNEAATGIFDKSSIQ